MLARRPRHTAASGAVYLPRAAAVRNTESWLAPARTACTCGPA